MAGLGDSAVVVHYPRGNIYFDRDLQVLADASIGVLLVQQRRGGAFFKPKCQCCRCYTLLRRIHRGEGGGAEITDTCGRLGLLVNSCDAPFSLVVVPKTMHDSG